MDLTVPPQTKELGSLLKTYEKDSLIPQTKNCENALGKLIKNSTDPSQPNEAVNEALRDYLIQLKTLNSMFKELVRAPSRLSRKRAPWLCSI